MTTIDVACYPLVPDGPLAEWVRPFQAEMVGLGFTARTAQDNAYVMVCLSRWMQQVGVTPDRLGVAGLEEFVQWRRELGYRRWRSIRSLREMLGFLRQAGIIPEEQVHRPADPVSVLVESYAGYLRRERRLRENTIAGRAAVAERFLGTLLIDGQVRLELLGPQAVVDFVLASRQRYAVGSMKGLTVCLRSLLRYLFADDIVDRDYSGCVPSVAGWRLSSLPASRDGDVLSALLGACDRSTALGLRDYAVLMLMARLGLRAVEISRLCLEDLDWRRGEMVVHGKGGRIDRLPLPVDVGRALTDYLRRGRRTSAVRQVFLRTIGPDAPMSRESVVMVPRCASTRAGVATVAAHSLRHRAACRVLADGGNLGEVAQLLRHEAHATAAIYAKVDLAALSAAARPWPQAQVGAR